MAKHHDAFVSYSHSADGRIAPALERGLEQLGKKWRQRQAMDVFRDETSLAVSPHLWDTIAEELEESDFLVLLLSPDAAQSAWVGQEIDFFLEHSSPDQLLLVLTDGELAWDEAEGDWSRGSTAIPPALRRRLAAEPLWVDLRWARTEDEVDLRHTQFRDAVASLAAAIRGVSKDEIEGEDVRAHRQAVRVRRIALAVFVLLLAGVATGAGAAFVARNDAAEQKALKVEADTQREIAEENEAEADQQRGIAEDNTAEADTQREIAEENEAEADQQRGIAEDNTAEADRQRTIAEGNEAEAELQRGIAEDNEAEAELQRGIAEDNAAEAELQRGIAEDNAAEADYQRGIAECWSSAWENVSKYNSEQTEAAFQLWGSTQSLAKAGLSALDVDDISGVRANLEAIDAIPSPLRPMIGAIAGNIIVTAENECV